MVRYGSLFSGAGLLDFGLHRSIPSLRCEFAIEINDARRAMFGAHFPRAELHGNIETTDPAALPAIDGLIGGVPCNTHSTANSSGQRGLAPQWEHARRIIDTLRPAWTLWESSSKDQSWRRWVPFVRRDLGCEGHASVSFRLRTRGRGAAHDRERAFVISWRASAYGHCQGQSPRAVHAAISSLCAAPAAVWNGRIPARAHGRMADGASIELARAIGYGVDQRTAADAARVLGTLIRSLAGSTRPPTG